MSLEVAVVPLFVAMGLRTGVHPFMALPTFRALADTMAFDELLAALRTPEVKARILAERSDASTDLDLAVGARVAVALDRAHPADDLADLGDLGSGSATSIAAQAEAAGIDAFERCYDALLDQDGAAMIHLVLGAVGGHDQTVRRLLDDHAVPSWSRAGAPMGVVGCEAGPTVLLSRQVDARFSATARSTAGPTRTGPGSSSPCGG